LPSGLRGAYKSPSPPILASDSMTASPTPRRLSVGVTVTLHWTPSAGGHVKCWERFADAACDRSDLDLTIYFLGDERHTVELADHVRYEILPAVIDTARIPGLQQGAGHTDLAFTHPAARRLLGRHDVLHTTDVFSLSRSAHRVARRGDARLVSSVHTDLPQYTEIYGEDIIRRKIPGRVAADWVMRRIRPHHRAALRMRRKVDRLLARADRVLAANSSDLERLKTFIPSDRVGSLRLGVDRELFHPRHRDRTRLEDRFGIPRDQTVVFFCGRIDRSKRVMTVACALDRLRRQGIATHFLAAGDGVESDAVRALLGPDATLAGSIDHEELGWIVPSCDLFAFPSRSETVGMVVLEAMASGLAVHVADDTACAELVGGPGVNGVVVSGDDPEAWAAALRPQIECPDTRSRYGRAARERVESVWPTWGQVLDEDLLPSWRGTLQRRPGPEPGKPSPGYFPTRKVGDASFPSTRTTTLGSQRT
jgi:glycosyltransferase involved in cell wall biosynthesis